MRFSEQFDLPSNQAFHDFVDVPLDTDLAVFIDPHVVATTRTDWCVRCHQIVSDFFQTLLDRLRDGDMDGALALLCVSREDNRPRTGYSRRKPQGTGVGPEKAQILIERLTESAAFESGDIQELEDGALFADRIGLDTVSDLMVNLLHEQLAIYTLDQCTLLGVPTDASDQMHAWRPGEGWVTIHVRLPMTDGRPVILIPRSVVRTDLSLDPDTFLQHVLDDVDRGDEHATRALEKALQQPVPTISYKNGRVRTHRGKLEELVRSRPVSKKAFVAQVVGNDANTLRAYKLKTQANRSALSPADIEKLQRDPCPVDRAAVAREVQQAVQNTRGVSPAFWELVSGLVATFHPLLQHPRTAHTNIKGLVGFTMANAGADSVLRGLVRADGDPARTHVLVLAADQVLDLAFLNGLDLQRMLREADASIAICVARGMQSAVYEARAELREQGLVITTFPELSRLTQGGLSPEQAVHALGDLVGA